MTNPLERLGPTSLLGDFQVMHRGPGTPTASPRLHQALSFVPCSPLAASLEPGWLTRRRHEMGQDTPFK